MSDDLEGELIALSKESQRRLSLLEGKSTGAASQLNSMTAEDFAFFERIRRLTPQFDSIQQMFNRWQELAGTKK